MKRHPTNQLPVGQSAANKAATNQGLAQSAEASLQLGKTHREMASLCADLHKAALTPAKALLGQTLAVRGPSGTHGPGTLHAQGARRNEARALGRSWALGAA